MTAFTQYKAICQKCNKAFKTFGMDKTFTIVKNCQCFSFCPKCSKELGKIVEKWIKNK